MHLPVFVHLVRSLETHELDSTGKFEFWLVLRKLLQKVVKKVEKHFNVCEMFNINLSSNSVSQSAGEVEVPPCIKRGYEHWMPRGDLHLFIKVACSSEMY